jgi:ATP-dependent Clp protease ATP-binding subunit ClpC
MDFFPVKISSCFSARLKNIFKKAEEIALKKRSVYIEPEHLIYGIISESGEGSVGKNILPKKINEEILEKFFQNQAKELNKQFTRGATSDARPPAHNVLQTKHNDAGKSACNASLCSRSNADKQIKLSKETKDIFKKAAVAASSFGHKYIGTEHLIFGIFSQKNLAVYSFFRKEGVNVEKILERAKAFLESASNFMEMANLLNLDFSEKPIRIGAMAKPQNQFSAKPISAPNGQKETLALDYFCADLTAQAEKGNFDPVIAREKEIKQAINILSRRIKNNPVLIGQPGVGKTAVVQGLAQKIAFGEVSDDLAPKRILSLNLTALVAGTTYRGEFEERLKDILNDIEKNPDVIIFIDEIHTIIGAGSASGSLDAANILKPALASQNFQCIGATTLEEYRRYFKKDSALERRFQPVLIEEPNEKQSIEILLGLKSSYENFHNVDIDRRAIESAVKLSQRFISDRFLPDKAIDVLDEAAAFSKSRESGKSYFKEIKEINRQREKAMDFKEKAAMNEFYNDALQFKTLEKKLSKQIYSLEKERKEEMEKKNRSPVTVEDVAEIVSKISGIPANIFLQEEQRRLKNLELIMSKRLIGQKEAIKELAQAIRRSRSKISDPNRPLGSFVFLGPTGVGKTETARVLANLIYQDSSSLIKIDMSDFSEPHTVSRLVGAPAGYVGYGEGGKLTEAVRLKPNSIILFDEIEKAHPDVFNILLQILEDGELVDAQGEKVNFKNTIVIMTSNLGTVDFTREAIRFGFSESEKKKSRSQNLEEKYSQIKKRALGDLKELFRPELLNRINKVIVFKPLGQGEIKRIVNLQFKDLAKRLSEEKIKLALSKNGLDFIAEKSFDTNQGARLIRRNIENLIENPLAEKIINGEIKQDDCVKIDVKNGKIFLKKI